MKIGIVGLDSTHAIEFTQRLNSPTALPAWRGARVVASCAGAPTDFPLSVARRDRISSQMRDELHIPQLPDPKELMESVDAAMILGCDGRTHFAEALPLLSFGKPLFIDKPLTASLLNAAQLLDAAKQLHCPIFSASALRYRSNSARATRLARARTTLIEVTVPDVAMPGHPDFSWHGIHGVETAFAVLGRGCETVERVCVHRTDAVHATWANGARAIIKRMSDDAAMVFPTTLCDGGGIREEFVGFSYEPLLTAIVDFFASGITPVPVSELLEVIAFIAAADQSRNQAGQIIHVPTLVKETGVDL